MDLLKGLTNIAAVEYSKLKKIDGELDKYCESNQVTKYLKFQKEYDKQLKIFMDSLREIEHCISSIKSLYIFY